MEKGIIIHWAVDMGGWVMAGNQERLVQVPSHSCLWGGDGRDVFL
jgi:hypothetical protein